MAQAAAAAAGQPLWRHLCPEGTALPLPEIQIFGGGAHPGRRVDIQDLMIVRAGAGSFSQALEWTAEVYRVAGKLMAMPASLLAAPTRGASGRRLTPTRKRSVRWSVRSRRPACDPGEQVAISLDVAASEFGKGGAYRLGLEGRELDSECMIVLLLGWLEHYPIISIEDSLAEDDLDGFAAFARAAPEHLQIVADDLTVTDAARVRDVAARGSANTLLVKPNQRGGTLTETKATYDTAGAAGWRGIVSARSGETEGCNHGGTVDHRVVARSLSAPQRKECLRRVSFPPPVASLKTFFFPRSAPAGTPQNAGVRGHFSEPRVPAPKPILDRFPLLSRPFL